MTTQSLHHFPQPSSDEINDSDPNETQEWLEALDTAVQQGGHERGLFLLNQLNQQARLLGITSHGSPYSAYQNTIPVEHQGIYPGNVALEERLTSIIRWNALAMVVRANRAYGELGGHISSYASAAEIFEVGFNHFFRATHATQEGDLVFMQPHSAPGVYARAYLEGRLSEDQLAHYRQEISGEGLCSYPHPWLMPDFWQFPTGSMGLGPINSIYHARFMRYLQHRNLADTADRHVWGIFGDGEMDEPESIGALSLAAREGLDNLTFIINCNLQRLDGPVRGNGQVIQELESIFTGAGWNVIKVLWGSGWDALLARDTSHALLRAFAETVDGQYQTYKAKDGHYGRNKFFGQNPQLQELVAHMSDDEIAALNRGGHDVRKLFAAFSAARNHKGQPTVILAKTIKGYGMGLVGQGLMTTHQQKKLDIDALKEFRDRFHLPLSDDEVAEMRFYRPPEDSPEMHYFKQRRDALGGFLPARRRTSATIAVPPLESYGHFALAAEEKEMSTTMAIVRLFSNLLKDAALGPRIVPIVADEARTFGMANLFRQIGIYSPVGQLYEPEDSGSMLYYKESTDGQLLEEGITEAGALSSWIAAATSYSVHNLPMLPFYIYYSMFGFQRVGDLIWAAADQRARGFLIGATAGRTTLGGEGLQHQDGSSHLIAATVPNCRAYDPAFAYEVAVILDHGMRRMLEQQKDEFYYLTVMNENYAHPSIPSNLTEIESSIIKGMYRYRRADATAATPQKNSRHVQLLGSGAILREVIAAADLLLNDWQVSSEIFSVTSFSELARDAHEVARWNRLHPEASLRQSHLAQHLADSVPIIAATDYVRAYPQLIAPYVQSRFITLGTDGFGRSDTRVALRKFFEVDRHHIVLAALDALTQDGHAPRRLLREAIERYNIETEYAAPWER